MTLTIAALVTNYNTWNLTLKCTQAIAKLSGDQITQILVMDDASCEEMPTQLPNLVRVIRNPKNLGLLANTNRGFAHLEEDIIILFDSDAYPLVDATAIVRQKFIQNSRLGALVFQTVDEVGNPTASWQSAPDAFGLLLGQKLEAIYRSWQQSGDHKPILCYQCAVAIRRSAFVEIGGFDEGFDWLDADLDFSLRLHAAGWQIAVETELKAFHKGGGTFQLTSARVMRHHKNRWRLLAKHNLIPYPGLLKLGLATRHTLEYIMLRFAGRFLFSHKSIIQDKIKSRQQLLQSVWSGYGNDA